MVTDEKNLWNLSSGEFTLVNILLDFINWMENLFKWTMKLVLIINLHFSQIPAFRFDELCF